MGYCTEETYALTVRACSPIEAYEVFETYFRAAHADGELHTVIEDVQDDGKVSAFGCAERYGAHVAGTYHSGWAEQMAALATWFDGTVDVVTEEGGMWRWRLRDGAATQHEATVTYPTDVEEGPVTATSFPSSRLLPDGRHHAYYVAQVDAEDGTPLRVYLNEHFLFDGTVGV